MGKRAYCSSIFTFTENVDSIGCGPTYCLSFEAELVIRWSSQWYDFIKICFVLLILIWPVKFKLSPKWPWRRLCGLESAAAVAQLLLPFFPSLYPRFTEIYVMKKSRTKSTKNLTSLYLILPILTTLLTLIKLGPASYALHAAAAANVAAEGHVILLMQCSLKNTF